MIQSVTCFFTHVCEGPVTCFFTHVCEGPIRSVSLVTFCRHCECTWVWLNTRDIYDYDCDMTTISEGQHEIMGYTPFGFTLLKTFNYRLNGWECCLSWSTASERNGVQSAHSFSHRLEAYSVRRRKVTSPQRTEFTCVHSVLVKALRHYRMRIPPHLSGHYRGFVQVGTWFVIRPRVIQHTQLKNCPAERLKIQNWLQAYLLCPKVFPEARLAAQHTSWTLFLFP